MESVWSKTCSINKRESLKRDIQTEIAVIGAGMAGILTAYYLQKAGKKVVVLEAARIASGQTRNTTAKITSLHGMIYRELTDSLGEERARLYGQANEEAVAEFKHLIEEQKISCDFEEQDAYIYSESRKDMEQEALAAENLGLPAQLITDLKLPVPFQAAVRFSHQAQFHPLKFIKEISESLTIYENSMVKEVEDHVVKTDEGSVTADQIIFACHFPFINFPGMYFAKMHQERSYVIALEQAGHINGMAIGQGEHPYSFRNYKQLLFVGGENHRTGENTEGGRYHALRMRAKEWFPESREAACWSAQDCMTGDHVPYIGQYAAGKPDWYVATGFGKWGMTHSMVSALLLRDLILGKENPYAEVFDPGRFSMENIPEMAGEGGQAVKGLVRRIFQIPDETVKELEADHGGIVELDGEKAGVYKDKEGNVYAVDIRCPHMGCQLEWNPDEKSWDCPCHGSRFDYQGNLISNPAQEGIAHE